MNFGHRFERSTVSMSISKGVSCPQIGRGRYPRGRHTRLFGRSAARELDYNPSVRSISRFAFGREKQTEQISRAMDNRFFTILGHATGRLLLKRPGYEIDMERIAAYAKQTGCFFEINSSPDRLDLSGRKLQSCSGACSILIAISTDAHSDS